jgi:hypothetical protein
VEDGTLDDFVFTVGSGTRKIYAGAVEGYGLQGGNLTGLGLED